MKDTATQTIKQGTWFQGLNYIGGNGAKTYLIVYYNSESAPLTEVAERLMQMRFRPIAGSYDYEYDLEPERDP